MVGMMCLAAALLSTAALSVPLPSGLSYVFHDATCPNLLHLVHDAVENALERDIGNAAGLLRFFFNDCFPQGCDASILLARGNSMVETDIPPNRGLRGSVGQLIENIHRTVHAACGPTVSCVDILALTTRAAVMHFDVPGYQVPLGRLDNLQPASRSKVDELPGADFDAAQLQESFRSRGLDAIDLVALSGAHTIGRSRCISLRNRHGESVEFVQQLKDNCARKPPTWPQDLDVTTPHVFDNNYYGNLKEGKGVFNSDMALTHHPNTTVWVDGFALDQGWFFAQFGTSMSKVAHLLPVDQEMNGEIRKHCRFQNNVDKELVASS